MTDQDDQTDQDLIVGHPFTPSAWEDTCGHQLEDGWFCGYAEVEHVERLEGAMGGGEAIEQP